MYEFPWIGLGLLLNGAAIDRVRIVGGMGLYLSQTLNIALQHYYEIVQLSKVGDDCMWKKEAEIWRFRGVMWASRAQRCHGDGVLKRLRGVKSRLIWSNR